MCHFILEVRKSNDQLIKMTTEDIGSFYYPIDNDIDIIYRRNGNKSKKAKMDLETAILNERRKLIDDVKREVGKMSDGKRPLKIVFIGTPGCGKSSAINTIAAAFASDHWREYAVSGSAGGAAKQITYLLRSFECEKYCRADYLKGYAMPTLIDIAGFQDEDTDLNIEILRIILFGKLKKGASPMDAYEYGHRYGIVKMKQKYGGNNWNHVISIINIWPFKHWSKVRQLISWLNSDHLKVDRIVFVASGLEQVPDKLIACVTKASRPHHGASNREIPLFGLMTKADQVDESSTEFKERKNKFLKQLSLEGVSHKFAQCVNYCDTIDPDNTRIDYTMPDVDIPMLKFMKVVCGENFEVANDDLGYHDTVGAGPGDSMGHVVIIVVVLIFSMLFMVLLINLSR